VINRASKWLGLLGAAITLTMGCVSSDIPSGLDANSQLTNTVLPATDGFAYQRLQHGVQVRVGETVRNIIFYGPDVVRVNANLGKTFAQHPSLVVVDAPSAPDFSMERTSDALLVRSAKLVIHVDAKTGAVTFRRADGTVILREDAARPSNIKEVTISGAPTYEVTQRFTLKDRESLYGLGQYTDPYWDYRGQEVYMAQSNIGICIPFLISTERYGIMWDIYSKSIFKDGPEGMSLYGESAPAGVDYYFMAGNTMDDVIAAYRRLTGPAPMFAKSAFGLWMSKERYRTQDQLIQVVRNFRKDGFPIDNIVQDWQYWGEGQWGGEWPPTWSGMIWDKARYPDPAGMARTLHEDLHVQLMCSIWPSVGNGTALARELDQYGLRHEPLHWISKKARIYDAYSEKGREIYFKHTKKGLLDVGVDALWMDGTEVEVGNACHGEKNTEEQIKRLGTNAMGDYTRYLNTYSLMTTKGVYEGQRAVGDNRVFTLTRSAFTGQQRYAALSWSGDTSASYRMLREQISGGLNVCMAGQPYWTHDIGGFFVGGNWRSGGKTTPEYNELFARWNQFGIFNPIYRIHGTDIEREPYVFRESDPEVYDSLLDAAHLRYRLLPYIYSLAWQSTVNGYTMMRGMPMDFPDDQGARKLDSQFMFGPAFLARPVVEPLHRVPAPPAATIPNSALTTPEGQPGISVEYFQGRNFDKAAGKVVEPKVDQAWPGPPLTDFPPGLSSNNDFSTKWNGVVTMPEDGEYDIGAEGDDGVRVWLDNDLIVDDWGEHPMRWRYKRMTFQKGQQVAVRIEHFQGAGERGLRVAWKTPSALAEEAKMKSEDKVATYLPPGEWYDFWTNKKVEGNREISRSCPMNIVPLYVRAGSIVPMGPAVVYVGEKAEAPYEIRIYPGADAAFTLYEDEGDNYNYESGSYATIPFTWDEGKHKLTIGARQGSFPGMLTGRTFRVVWVSPGHGSGISTTTTPDSVVTYTGLAVAVSPNP